MKKDIIYGYQQNVLMPIENFMKKQEYIRHRNGKNFTKEDQQLFEKSQHLFFKKLEYFSKICEEEFQMNQKH